MEVLLARYLLSKNPWQSRFIICLVLVHEEKMCCFVYCKSACLCVYVCVWLYHLLLPYVCLWNLWYDIFWPYPRVIWGGLLTVSLPVNESSEDSCNIIDWFDNTRVSEGWIKMEENTSVESLQSNHTFTSSLAYEPTLKQIKGRDMHGI